MAWTVDVAFVHAFDANIQHLSSEAADMVAQSVRMRPAVRGKTYSIERINGVEPSAIVSRHADTGLTPFTHTRRRLSISDFGLSEIIDDIDVLKMLISPQSDYAQEFARSYNRRTAQTIFNAMNGNATAVGADDVTSNVALPAGQQIANGAAGLTMAKVRQAARILDVNGVPATDRWFATSPFGIEDLLTDATVTSSDFSTLQALMHGTIPQGSTWMGFKWLKITDALGAGVTMASPILPKAANIRSCFAYHKNSVTLGLQREFNTEIVPDPGKWNNTRVMVKFSQGAVRVEDEAAVRVDIDESV